MINEDSIQVPDKTEDSISEPRQVGQESGISPWLCMCNKKFLKSGMLL